MTQLLPFRTSFDVRRWERNYHETHSTKIIRKLVSVVLEPCVRVCHTQNMTTTEVTRTTQRKVTVPDDVRIILEDQFVDKEFRVRTIVETLEEFSDGDTDTTYRVKVVGPRLTRSGADHATLRGERTFWNISRDTDRQTVGHYLIGASALKKLTVTA